jgi:hypothetical protein
VSKEEKEKEHDVIRVCDLIFHSDSAGSCSVPPNKLQQEIAGSSTSDLDSSPEIHGQVEDVVRGDNFAGGPVHDVAVLVEQGDHVAAPARIKYQRRRII